MAFEKHLSELQEKITKFLEIHANPYDTSKHNETAEKLEKIQTALLQTKTTKKPELEDNDCEEKFARIKAFYSRSDVSTFFSDFNNITEKEASENQIKKQIDSSSDAFVLCNILKLAYETDKPDNCWESWTLSQQNQYNYSTSRRIYLTENEVPKYKKIDDVIGSLHALEKKYNELPIAIQNIADDINYLNTLMLCDNQTLQLIQKSIAPNSESKFAAKEQPISYLTHPNNIGILNSIPQQHIKPYYKAIKSYTFLQKQYELGIIEKLINQNPASENTTKKTNVLSLLLLEIDQCENNLFTEERADEYQKAKEIAKLLLQKWKTFKQSYESETYQNIKEVDIAGTRCENSYKKINEYYTKSEAEITKLGEAISHNYDSLQAVTDYQKKRREVFNTFESGYMIGNPTSEDAKNITDLIALLKKVITAFNANSNLKEISSLEAKDLPQELKTWEDRLIEVNTLLLQKNNWKDAKKIPGIDGYSLEPKTFAKDKPILNKNPSARLTSKFPSAKNLPVGVLGTGDNSITDPNDVDQGTIGDCYFLASIASMAKDKNFFYGGADSVISIIHPEIKKGKKIGQFDPKKIEYFSVRMYLPVEITAAPEAIDKKTGRTKINVLVYPDPKWISGDALSFAQKADSGELWVAILERAFAEIRGGYSNIEGGFPEEGFALLMNKSSEDINRFNFDDKAVLYKLKQGYKDENLSDADVIEKKLTESISSKISLSTPSESELLSLGGIKSGSSVNGDSQVSFYWNNPSPKPTDKPDLILYANHAYSLQGISNNKFQLRNPHGLSADPKIETLFELSAVQLVKLFDAVVIVK